MAFRRLLVTGSGGRLSVRNSVQVQLDGFVRTRREQWGSCLLSKAHLSSQSLDQPTKKSKEAIVYEGPLAGALQKVKLLSLSTCCLSVSCGPALTFFTAGDMSVVAKGALASAMILLSASTTAALHWIASPYVRKLIWIPGSKEMEVEVLSWMATSFRKTIRIADVQPPETQRPLVTFAADGSFYFIDKDKFPNQELLKKLTP